MIKCAACDKPLRPGPKQSDRAAIINLRLLYGADSDGKVDDCAVMCAACAGDAWEVMLRWIKARRAEGVEVKP